MARRSRSELFGRVLWNKSFKTDAPSPVSSFSISIKDLPDVGRRAREPPGKTAGGPDKGFDKIGELL
jgi:hypothetical protein